MAKSSGKLSGPDKLTKTGKKAGIELTEKDLDRAKGGAADIFAKLGDIKSEAVSRPRYP